QHFLQMLQCHPNALGSKQIFSGLLRDYFSQERMMVNLMIALFDMGIHSEIENTPQVTNVFGYRFVKRLMGEYGVLPENAEKAVHLFCKCYGGDVLNKPCDWDSETQSQDRASGSKYSPSNHERASEIGAPVIARVKIALRPIKRGVASELVVTEKQILVNSSTGDGAFKCQCDFGLNSDLGKISLNAMRDCLEAKEWDDVQLPQNVHYADYFYELEAEYKNSRIVAHRGAFDRIHIPEKEFGRFIESIRSAMEAVGQDGILSLDYFMSAIRSDEVKYCGVAFPYGSKIYHYRTTDLRIAVGDIVAVPVGNNNSEKEAIVATVEICRLNNTPYPLKKTKEIIRLISTGKHQRKY
ncbi:MAG: hypothetical protein LBQ86_01260, partial [Holophagales bacterium]|nr:hypothetical protein [Holophagales bacterium]